MRPLILVGRHVATSRGPEEATMEFTAVAEVPGGTLAEFEVGDVVVAAALVPSGS